MDDMNGSEVLVEETEQKMVYKVLDLIHEAKESGQSLDDLERTMRELIKK